MADDEDWLQFTFSDDDDEDNNEQPTESLNMDISLHMSLNDTIDDIDDNTNQDILQDSLQSNIDDEETQSDHDIDNNQLQETIPISQNESDIQSDASLEDLQTQNSDFNDHMSNHNVDQQINEIATDENKNNQSTIPPLILNTTSVIAEQTNKQLAVGISDTMNIDQHADDIDNNIENKNNYESNEMKLPLNDNDSSVSPQLAVKHGRKRTIEERDDEEEKEEIHLSPPAKRMRHDDVEVSKTLRRSKRFERNEEIVLLRTGGTINIKKRVDEENKKLEEMGAIILDKYEETVSHIVINEPMTTLKFMCGLADTKYIVNDIWPTMCVKKGNFVIDEKRYFPIKGVKLFEKKYGCLLKEILKKRDKRNNLLFEDKKIYFISDCDKNMKLGIEQMAEAHGAECVNRIPREYDEELIVIGDDINSKHCKNAKKKGYVVWSKDIIITSILRQNIETSDSELELND
eukprot:86409_1